MILLLVCRRLIWGGLLFAIYGLCSTWPRLPLDMSITNRLASLVWAAGLFAGAGAAVGGMISMLAFIAGRTAPPRYRPTMSAIVETTILLFLVIWITLNEFVYLTTSEVLGLNTLLLLWHNTAAVLENAWKMGGRYLLATAGIALAIGTALFILTRRSYRSIQLPGNRPTGASATIIPGLTAGIMIVFLTVATLIGRQFHTAPSQSLVELSRSAPLLRVFNLTRALMKIDLTGSPPDHFGPPIISQEQYQTTMGTPRHPAPNIIYILMESTSAGALHCYCHPKADITPHIDALAAEGALFEHCLAAASFSSCGLTSIITSLYLLRGERFDYFSDPFPFMGLPRALKLAGYQLTLFSSGNESFDRINHFYPPSDFDVYFSHDTCKINKSDCMRMDDKYAIGEFEKWLSGRRDARPFYTGFYLQSPHFNYEVPEPWYSHDQPIPPPVLQRRRHSAYPRGCSSETSQPIRQLHPLC